MAREKYCLIREETDTHFTKEDMYDMFQKACIKANELGLKGIEISEPITYQLSYYDNTIGKVYCNLEKQIFYIEATIASLTPEPA